MFGGTFFTLFIFSFLESSFFFHSFYIVRVLCLTQEVQSVLDIRASRYTTSLKGYGFVLVTSTTTRVFVKYDSFLSFTYHLIWV
jgi:hypothetical protein